MFARFRDSSDFGHVSAPNLMPPYASGQAATVPHGSRLMSLGGGRLLSWEEYGHRHGFPVIYYPSQAGSRLEGGFLHEAALASGFRLIAMDRPGIGMSSFRRLQRHNDFNEDVLALINHLDLHRPGLLAWAGGSPFALAMASQHSDLISFVSLLAPGRSPVFGFGGKLNRLMMGVLRGLVHFRQRWRRGLTDCRAEEYMARLSESLCYADRKQIDNPWIHSLLVRDANEAMRQGTRGIAQDSVMGLSCWEFDIGEIKVPVHLWQGGADTLTSPVFAGELRAALPDAVLHTVQRHGHFFFTCVAGDIFRVARSALQGRLRLGLR